MQRYAKAMAEKDARISALEYALFDLIHVCELSLPYDVRTDEAADKLIRVELKKVDKLRVGRKA